MSVPLRCDEYESELWPGARSHSTGVLTSVDPIVSLEHAITRCAVATDKEAEKQDGDNRTMGRKFTVPYGLYRCHGFVNPFLSPPQTGFGSDNLNSCFGRH